MFNFKSFLECFLLLCFISCISSHQKPGIKIKVSQKGLNELARALVNNEIKNLTGIKFPDAHGIVETFFGGIVYNLTEIQILEASCTSFNVTLEEAKNGIRLNLINGSISLGTNWRYGHKNVRISDEGYVSINFHQVTFDLTIIMKSRDGGRVALLVDECTAEIKKPDFKFEGKHRQIYNFLKSLLNRYLRHPCDVIKNLIKNKELPSKFRKPINRFLDLDFSLTDVPLIRNDHLEINLKGQFFAANDSEEAPYQVQDILTDNKTAGMLNIWLTKYSVNTMLRSFFKLNKLQRRISKEDFVGNFHEHFASSCWSFTCAGFYFPTLRFLYPDSYLEIDVRATEAPRFAVGTKGVSVHLKNTTTTFYARTKNNSEHNLFTFSLNLLLRVDLSLTSEYFHWRIVDHSFSMNLINTNIGPVPDMLLSNGVEMVFSKFVLPGLNNIGEVGHRLRLPFNLKLEETDLKTERGNLFLQTDFKFQNEL